MNDRQLSQLHKWIDGWAESYTEGQVRKWMGECMINGWRDDREGR